MTGSQLALEFRGAATAAANGCEVLRCLQARDSICRSLPNIFGYFSLAVLRPVVNLSEISCGIADAHRVRPHTPLTEYLRLGAGDCGFLGFMDWGRNGIHFAIRT